MAILMAVDRFLLDLHGRTAAAAHGTAALVAHGCERVAGPGGTFPAEIYDERRPDKQRECYKKGK